MQDFLFKMSYSLENDVFDLAFLISARIGFNFSDHLDSLPNVINEKTELSVSCTAYIKNGCHGGYFPPNVNNLSDGWIPTEDFLSAINSLAINDNINLDQLNKALIQGMILQAERVNLKEKVEILERALNKL